MVFALAEIRRLLLGGVLTRITIPTAYSELVSQVQYYGTACAGISCVLAGIQWAPQVLDR